MPTNKPDKPPFVPVPDPVPDAKRPFTAEERAAHDRLMKASDEPSPRKSPAEQPPLVVHPNKLVGDGKDGKPEALDPKNQFQPFQPPFPHRPETPPEETWGERQARESIEAERALAAKKAAKKHA